VELGIEGAGELGFSGGGRGSGKISLPFASSFFIAMYD